MAGVTLRREWKIPVAAPHPALHCRQKPPTRSGTGQSSPADATDGVPFLATAAHLTQMQPDESPERGEIIAGLTAKAASVSPKYFYAPLLPCLSTGGARLCESSPHYHCRGINQLCLVASYCSAGRKRHYSWDVGDFDCVCVFESDCVKI